MSVSSTTNKVQYDGNGATKTFAFSYPVRAAAELEVILTVDSTGVETVQTITTHYSVTITTNSSASIVFVTAPPSGTTVTINRIVPLTNLNTFNAYDGNFTTNIEEEVDRGSMKAQRLQEQLDRTIKCQTSDVLDGKLPPLVGNDGKYIQVDDDGDGTFSLSLSASTVTDGVTNAGPETDNTVARFDGTTGQVIQGSGVVIDDSDNVTGVTSINVGSTIAITGVLDEDAMGSDSAVKLATQQSIKAYVDAGDAGAGDASGPASSTDNAIARFDGTGGKTLQDSSCTIDDSDNMIIAGDLRVDGDDVYIGATSPGAASTANRTTGSHLHITPGTNASSRIIMEGDNNDTAASCALVMYDDNGTVDARSLVYELGIVTNTASLHVQNDNGINPRYIYRIAMGATPTFRISPVTTFDTDVTMTAGDLTVTAGTATFGGDLLLTGSGVNKIWTKYIPASSMEPFTTNGAAVSHYENSETCISALAFDQTTSEYAGFHIDLGDDYDGSSLQIKFHWTAASGAGTVAWLAECIVRNNDEALSTGATNTHSATDTLIATGDLHTITVSAAPDRPGSGTWLYGRLRRNAGADTLTADALLIGISISYA